MAKSPAGALQIAVVAALKADAGVIAALGGNAKAIMDAPATNAPFPRVLIGDDQLVDDSNCGAAWEAFVTIHVYSRTVGKPEAKLVGDCVQNALDVALSLGTEFECVWSDDEPAFRDARYFKEADNLTTHGVLTFRYLIDQT